MHDARMPSPKSAYPQHQPPYPAHPDAGPNGPEPGMQHPPQQGMPSDPSMHRDHDPRPPSVGPKRLREWEDDRDVKKPSTEETRARMDDMRHRRPSTPPRMEPYRRNSSEARRFDDRRMEDARRAEEQRRVEDMRRAEEQRHPNEAYHPSEAAHHPQSHSVPAHLPPMQQAPMQGHIHEGQGPQQGPGPKDYPQPEERRIDQPPASHPPITNQPERAGRTIDVDEDYDDSGEEDKKGGILSGGASGPGSASSDLKNGAPPSAGLNGIMGPKVEGN